VRISASDFAKGAVEPKGGELDGPPREQDCQQLSIAMLRSLPKLGKFGSHKIMSSLNKFPNSVTNLSANDRIVEIAGNVSYYGGNWAGAFQKPAAA
jgi:hypothetical protein